MSAYSYLTSRRRVRKRAGGRRAALAAALLAALAPAPAGAAVAAPDDPLFRLQWNLRMIEIPAAWALSRGAGATVAVLDSGVAFQDRGPHRRAPDLATTRFVPGWDFVDDDPHPDDVPPAGDRRSHGTMIAAIIAQAAGNGIGGAGVAPAAAIMPVRVLDPDLAGSTGAVARGLRFAVDHGADVVNLSLSASAPRPAVTRAIRYAASKGVVLVAAAGNDGRASISWPAAYPQVIAVGAVARDLTRAPYSNYGPGLDLVAPAGAGERLDGGFGPADGILAQAVKGAPGRFCLCFMASTSAAAAEVSGVAALLVGSGRARTPAAVRAALVRAARDLGPPGRDPEYGAGLVQARRTLEQAAPARARARRVPAPSPDRRPLVAAGGSLVVALAGAVAVRRRRRRAR